MELSELCEAEMRRLLGEAQELTTDYWTFRHQENDKRPTQERTSLGVRAKMKGGAVRIEWFRYRAYGRNERGGQAYADYIRKGQNRFRYTRQKLTQNTQPWEEEKVQELEDQFARIRKSVHDLVNIRKHARQIGKREGLQFQASVQNSPEAIDETT